MAYRPVKLGATMSEDPKAAHAKLTALFARLKTIQAVAAHLKIDRHTIQRWIARLVKAGLSDPKDAGKVTQAAAE